MPAQAPRPRRAWRCRFWEELDERLHEMVGEHAVRGSSRSLDLVRSKLFHILSRMENRQGPIPWTNFYRGSHSSQPVLERSLGRSSLLSKRLCPIHSYVFGRLGDLFRRYVLLSSGPVDRASPQWVGHGDDDGSRPNRDAPARLCAPGLRTLAVMQQDIVVANMIVRWRESSTGLSQSSKAHLAARGLIHLLQPSDQQSRLAQKPCFQEMVHREYGSTQFWLHSKNPRIEMRTSLTLYHSQIHE